MTTATDVQAPAGVPSVPAEDEVGAVADDAVGGPGHVEDGVLAAEPEGPGYGVVLRDDRPDGVVEAVDRQGQPAAARPARRGMLGDHAWVSSPREPLGGPTRVQQACFSASEAR